MSIAGASSILIAQVELGLVRSIRAAIAPPITIVQNPAVRYPQAASSPNPTISPRHTLHAPDRFEPGPIFRSHTTDADIRSASARDANLPPIQPEHYVRKVSVKAPVPPSNNDFHRYDATAAHGTKSLKVVLVRTDQKGSLIDFFC